MENMNVNRTLLRAIPRNLFFCLAIVLGLLAFLATSAFAVHPWQIYYPPEGGGPATASTATASEGTCIYFRDFHDGGQDWTPYNPYVQDAIFWQRENYNGQGVMWCGTNDPNLIVTPPGYANDWIQFLTKTFTITDDDVLYYRAQYDTEAGYDFLSVLISQDGGETYDVIAQYDGNSNGFINAEHSLAAYPAGEVMIRFFFFSDWGWSDELDQWGDPALDSDGAFRIDDIHLASSTTVDDFELNDLDGDDNDGWVASTPNDGEWMAYRWESSLVCNDAGATEPCPDYCGAWAAYDQETGVFPLLPEELAAIPYTYLIKGIRSAEYILPQAETYTLNFDVFGDLPSENRLFYTWEIEIAATGEIIGNNTIYFNWGPVSGGFFTKEVDITNYVSAGDAIRIRLSAIDWPDISSPTYPYSGVHTAGPIFDNVGIYATGLADPTGYPVDDTPQTCETYNTTESGVPINPIDEDTKTSPVTLVFDNITGGGETSLTITDQGPPPPQGFKVGTPPTYFDITTTATFEDMVTICFDFSGISYNKESNLEIRHLVNGQWEPVLSEVNTEDDIICGKVTSFSLFAVFEAIEYWSDVSSLSGANDAGDSQGAAWGDYDNDGWDDIAIASWRLGVRLYHNSGDGTFTRVHSTLLDETEWGSVTGASWGDYDNDGDLDLYLAACSAYSPTASRILRNEGDGTFANATTAPADWAPDTRSGPWVDGDNDGYLDIYRGDRMLRGFGDGTFEDVSTYPLDIVGPQIETIAWGDYDNDGDQDVFKNRWHGVGYLNTNEGCMSFSRAAGEINIQPTVNAGCYGAEWGDYDNDGWLDLYRIQYNQPNHLYRNTGDGHFEDVTTAPLDFSGPSRDMTWIDFDNDGDLDIFVMVMDAPNKLFRNDGGNVWVEYTPAPLNENGMRGQVATADYDHDGDVDIYITGAWLANKLYRNNLDNGNHWLHVDLVGTVSNAAALGARIIVEAGGVSQIRELNGGDHSQGSLTAAFGLGANTTVDNVIVQWPSGIVTSTGPISTIDQKITLTESGTATDIVCEFERVIGGPEHHIGSMPNGAAWGDYDNDGDEDLFSVADPASGVYYVSLYGNEGYGVLADVTPPGLRDYQNAWMQSYTWIDYDNDGDLDLHYISWTLPDRLYANNGAGDFVNVSAASGLDDSGGAINAIWADYDNDGWVDCYIVKHGWNTLYRNVGDGTFINVTDDNIAVRAAGNEYGAMFGDYDNDGDQDLFVSRELGNYLLRNDAGTFVAWLDPAHPLVTTGRYSGVMWGDYDNDGWLDLALAGQDGLYLFHNDAGADFTLVSIGTDVAQGQDLAWVDYNNDGWLDLYVTCGGVLQAPTVFEDNVLYRNNADGTFTNVAYGAVLNSEGGAGAVWADFDNDGDQDVFMNTRYWSRARMVRNLVGTNNHWLQFKLVGKVSNAAAIGARVVVEADGLSMIREVNGGSGNSGQNSLRAAFGLGTATSADITILWPSGIVQQLVDVTADQILTIEEPTVGSVAGRVYGDCPEALGGLLGITVDAFENGTGILAGADTTDVDGYYQIDELDAGDYTMTIVTPLGYYIDSEEVQATVTYNDITVVDYLLTCVEATGDPRGIGFWKHQVGVALGGKGKAQIDAETLCGYLDEIEMHFNSNVINQVIVYEPPESDLCSDKLEVAKELLNLKGKVAKVERAKQHFMALLMNVAAAKLSLRAEISEDGATISQAITFCDSLVTDDETSNDERAKDIAEMINNTQMIPADWIPLTTADIAYSSRNHDPTQFNLEQNYPNPFNPETQITFDVPVASQVTLRVYDVAGRLVTTLVDRSMERGRHHVTWRGLNRNGQPVSSGIYLVRMEAGSYTKTMRMVLLK